MGQSNFKIEVTDDVVDARWDSSIGERIAIGVLSCGLALPLLYASTFQHGKRPGLVVFILDNPTLFKQYPNLIYMELIFIVLILSILGSVFVYGFRHFFPSADRLHCDRSTFTISKIAFWSFGKRWKSQSVLPSEVTDARYDVVFRSRGGKIYGIRANVRGKSWKVLPGIPASDAKTLLQGLGRMGVNVLPINEIDA
jgi:hypothetical protein